LRKSIWLWLRMNILLLLLGLVFSDTRS